jgi:hypothetical protein
MNILLIWWINWHQRKVINSHQSISIINITTTHRIICIEAKVLSGIWKVHTFILRVKTPGNNKDKLSSEKEEGRKNSDINNYSKEEHNKTEMPRREEGKQRMKDFLIMIPLQWGDQEFIKLLAVVFWMELEEQEDSGDLYSNTFIWLFCYLIIYKLQKERGLIKFNE